MSAAKAEKASWTRFLSMADVRGSGIAKDEIAYEGRVPLVLFDVEMMQ